MSKAEKILKRLLSRPKDFTWNELVNVLEYLGYKKTIRGKTGGSRRKFIDADNNVINLHKPHPGNIIKGYALKQVIEYLKTKGQLKDE